MRILYYAVTTELNLLFKAIAAGWIEGEVYGNLWAVADNVYVVQNME